MANELKEFFAVTKTSVYHVKDKNTGCPSIIKIALKGDSAFPVGHKLTGGSMISVGRWLMPFIPEGGGLTSIQTDISMVNTRYFGQSTSDITALFLKEVEAMQCFDAENLVFCDPRWIEKTKEVVDRIGEKHPYFVVKTKGDWGLVLETPKEK